MASEKMRLLNPATGLILILLAAACSENAVEHAPPATGFQVSDYFYPAPALDHADIVIGQVIYVPVYSHVYLSGAGKRELATTLSIRNTDPDNTIIIQAVRYYGTDGKLLENYLTASHRLAPLATAEFIIDQKDTRGGSGANFIVEWVAEQAVNDPVVEAVMAGISGTQGLSFIRNGHVIEEINSGR